MFGDPALRGIDCGSIAAVCGSCRHIGAYSLFPDSPDRGTRDEAIYAETPGKPVLLDWLRCEDKTCECRMALFVQWQGIVTGNEYRAIWPQLIWSDMKCPAGHSILRPVFPVAL
jgi:hypothetical protein